MHSRNKYINKNYQHVSYSPQRFAAWKEGIQLEYEEEQIPPITLSSSNLPRFSVVVFEHALPTPEIYCWHGLQRWPYYALLTVTSSSFSYFFLFILQLLDVLAKYGSENTKLD